MYIFILLIPTKNIVSYFYYYNVFRVYTESKPPPPYITHIICEVVTIVQDFLTNNSPVRMVGMSCEKVYIENVADRLLKESECPTLRTFIHHSNINYQI